MKKLLKRMRTRSDSEGDGNYGAKRGNRLHEGHDYLATIGENVFSPIYGQITKYGYVYPGNVKLRYVQIEGHTYSFKLMYVQIHDLVKVGSTVVPGQLIGLVQKMTGDLSPMKNHIHVECYKNGLLTDPKPLFNPFI